MKKNMVGFSIVEIVIVIVVIGILAAITTNVYGGARIRAENLKTVRAVKQYADQIDIYATKNGTYPIVDYACLGPYPETKCGNMTDTSNGYSYCNGEGPAISKAGFDTTMEELFSRDVPVPSTQQMKCSDKMYSGAWYEFRLGRSPQIKVFLRGNQSCDGIIGGITQTQRFQGDDMTACRFELPFIPE